MNREIKFRAVPNREATSLNYAVTYFTLEQLVRGQVNIGYPEHFVFNQFTGLKDKNGKEIYEGDIVRLQDPWKTQNEEESILCVVQYENGGFNMFSEVWHIGTNGKHLSDREWSMGLIEVIGNIYENPELLGGGGE